MAKKMYVQINWGSDPAKIKLGQGLSAVSLQEHFIHEFRDFMGSWVKPCTSMKISFRPPITKRK